MLDPQNLVNISGGMVADPEIVNGKIFKTRIGVDYSGSEKDSDNNSGYFEIVYYLKDKDGFVNKNASFVNTQVEQGKMKKGTSISLVGRLVQERWKEDGKGRSRIVIVAEHISYGARSTKSSDSTSSSTASSSSSTSTGQAASIPSQF